MRVRGPSQVTMMAASFGAWSAMMLAAMPATARSSVRAAPVLPWVSRSTIASRSASASRSGVLLKVRLATVLICACLPEPARFAARAAASKSFHRDLSRAARAGSRSSEITRSATPVGSPGGTR